MNRERIEDMREVVLPFVKKRLLETNYEGLGESDAKEFEREFNEILNLAIKALEQEPQTFKWCTDCKEYDQEKHCCHRWSKVIRDTVEEMKQEQEPILNKIRAEIESLKRFEIRGEVTPLVNVDRVLEIIDKAESEVDNGNDDNKV